MQVVDENMSVVHRRSLEEFEAGMYNRRKKAFLQMVHTVSDDCSNY